MDKRTEAQKIHINFPQIQLIMLKTGFKLRELNFFTSTLKKIEDKENFLYLSLFLLFSTLLFCIELNFHLVLTIFLLSEELPIIFLLV